MTHVKTTRTRMAIFAGSLALAMTLLAGCGSGQIHSGEATLAPNENSALFTNRIAEQPHVNLNDAMRGVLMLMEGEDRHRTFADRVQALRERGVVNSNWDLAAETPITRGQYAYMIHQAANMPDCVMTWALGPSQRYCLRELQYRGVMAEGAPYAVINGLEYVSVLRRADVYKRTGKVPNRAGMTDDL